MTTFAMRAVPECTYEAALVRVPEALQSEGFGVLTEIDVQKTLQQKLGVDFRRYKILGACNPPFAHEALRTELEVGVLLPCNVVIYEDDERHAVVLAIDPTMTVAATGNARLAELALDVKQRLTNALAKLDPRAAGLKAR
jgi:uncharacterized protein (DUF302 family)